MNVFRLLAALITGAVGTLVSAAVFVVVSPWVLVMLLTRWLSQLLEHSYSAWPQLVDFDPVFGWKARPNLNTYHLADDDVYQMTTDAEGWRGKTTIDQSEVLVFGDSYIFGHAASDAQFFADLNPRLRVKAIGVSGYNMVQEFMWIKRLAPRMKGKLAVWCIYLGNDITDSLVPSVEGYRIPFVRESQEAGGWEIVTSHLSRAPWPSGPRYHHATFYERVAKLFAPGPFATRAYSAAEYLIAEAARITGEVGSDLVVLSIPSKNMLLPVEMEKLTDQFSDKTQFNVDYPDQQLRQICQRCNVHFVPAKEHLQGSDYRGWESHWTPMGHTKVASLLARIHAERGPARARQPMLTGAAGAGLDRMAETCVSLTNGEAQRPAASPSLDGKKSPGVYVR